MPNPSFDVMIVSRRRGQSVVAAAAYRAGARFQDLRIGKSFDYTAVKSVRYKALLTPENTPAWARNRERLWNAVEDREKRKDAALARRIIAALPRELSTRQQIRLVRAFAKACFTEAGMIADIAIHERKAGDGGVNPYVHILLTTRRIEEGEFGRKNRDWNHRDRVREWRAAWEIHTNDALARAGRQERVSLRSYRELGIDKTPQPLSAKKRAILKRMA